jgi:ribosomal protein L7/L12
MVDLEKTYDKIAEAHLLARSLMLAIRGEYFMHDSEDNASALEALALVCVNRLDELVVATAFVTVELTAIGDKKIEVIKHVREFTGSGLKEAKDLVEAAPKILKEHVAMSDATEIGRALQAVGATVTLY